LNNDSEQHIEEQTGSAQKFPLAGRGQRLAAKILDGLVEMILLLPVAIYLDVPDYFAAIVAEEMVTFPPKLILQLAIAGFVMHLLLHSYLLYFYGQTIGKRIMGIAIVNQADKVPGYNRIIGLRYLPFYTVGQLPWISSLALVDILFIFREDHRCLHDLLAGTRVIDVTSRQVR
jgi:uncharacterized RDD family membrane protein YckC